MKKINQDIRAQVYKIIIWQLIIIAGFSLAILLLQGSHKGLSVGTGGMAYWIPTVIFVLRVTAHAGASAVTRFIVAFFTGEIVKLFLSGVLFILFIKYLPVDTLYTMMGFISAVVAFWIASVSSVYRRTQS